VQEGLAADVADLAQLDLVEGNATFPEEGDLLVCPDVDRGQFIPEGLVALFGVRVGVGHERAPGVLQLCFLLPSV